MNLAEDSVANVVPITKALASVVREYVARAVKDLASAQKISADRRLALETATKAKLIKAVDAVEGAIAGETDKPDAAAVLKRIRQDVYGIFDR